jgi:predicted transcriptional regulator
MPKSTIQYHLEKLVSDGKISSCRNPYLHFGKSEHIAKLQKDYSENAKKILAILESGPKTQKELSQELNIPVSTIQGQLQRLLFDKKLGSCRGCTLNPLGGSPSIYFGKPEHIAELRQSNSIENKILEALNEPRTFDYLAEHINFRPKTIRTCLKKLISGKKVDSCCKEDALYFGKPEQVAELKEKPSALESQLLVMLENPMTRDEIVKSSKIPRSTIFDSLKKLILKNEVVSYKEKNAARGRPRVYFLGAEKAKDIHDIELVDYDWK